MLVRAGLVRAGLVRTGLVRAGLVRTGLVRAGVAGLSFLAGSVPFSQLAARRFAGAALRQVGGGTVSGTALYEVAGFGPLALAGALDVAKGTAGPLLALRFEQERDRHLGAWAAAAAIAGHNWSPWLRGAGGRGLSPALGATLVLAPEATVVLGVGMAAGRLVRQSGVTTLAAVLGLVPLLGRRRGRAGAALGLSIAAPMAAKRLLGNGSPATTDKRGTPRLELLASRLVFDRDPPQER